MLLVVVHQDGLSGEDFLANLQTSIAGLLLACQSMMQLLVLFA
mgnify:CR=1 FL=1